MHKNPKVGIVVLNYNGGELAAQCIKNLAKNTKYDNYRIVLVDNGSTDGSLEKAKQLKGITILSLKENYGFSKGMNTGAWHLLKNYQPEYVMFANNDMRFPTQKNWLATLVKDLEEDSAAATVYPQFKDFSGKTVYSGANYATNVLGAIIRSPLKDGSKKQYIRCGYAGIVLVKTKVLQKTGLFDERFSPFWYEDFDLDRRIEKAGYRILYDPAITLFHAESATLKKIRDKKGEEYMKNIEKRNFIRYAYKHYSARRFAAALLYWLGRQFVQKKDNRYALRNPFNSIGQKMLELRKEKIRLTDHEAISRIKEIIQP